MIAILWTYRVRGDRIPEFEAIYSADGEWAELFRRAAGYLGTELLRQPEGSYATIDRWADAADFDRFKQRFSLAYEALDRRCNALTLAEEFIGVFEVVDAQPD